MNASFDAAKASLQLNPRRRAGSYPSHLQAILSIQAGRVARAEISSWEGYASTPLVTLPAVATHLGFQTVLYKDESGRFGLGSFKALGGAYAVLRLLADAVARETGSAPGANQLASGQYARITRPITVTCATDGNHGRSVAWGASKFNCGCVIYVHARVSNDRVDAIARYGAQVVRTDGTYDDAVRQADRDAAKFGRLIVSDTSYPGYLEIPRYVMQGYTVMVQEALQQITARGEAPPTHVFVQGGVGGLAAAVTAHLWETMGAQTPFVVVVEPDKAACLFESAHSGRPTPVSGELDTIMAGLACGEVSELAWQVLDAGAGAFMTIKDDTVVAAMRMLASGQAGPRIVGGESGVAGLAGLVCLAGRADWRESVGLGPQSRVLLIGSEGDTDPAVYCEFVGQSADAVRALAQ